MRRSLGLKRKGSSPPLGEENSAAFPKFKKQSFRPPFTRLKENIAECEEAQDENVVPNKIAELKLTGAHGEALPTPSTKEDLITSMVTLGQIDNPLVSERHENLEPEKPSLGHELKSRKPFNIGFPNTQFKFPGSSSSTVKNISLLSASKLNPENSNRDTSVSASGQEKSRQPGDSQPVNTFQSAFRKPFISRDLLNPAKDNTESSADANQTQYYSVLYAKRKKNTKPKGPWSDGVLLVNGRRCTLRSMDDKAITKVDCQGCGNLIEGTILQIGMFHVEVVRESSHDEYGTGALFMRNKSLSFHNVESIQRSNKRPSFPHPHFKAERDKNLPIAIKDLHKDAYILNAIQVKEGAAPIFIDPYLNTKLRPHQREGVKFLFESVMGLRSQDFQGCLLADEMGLGKTLQVISLIWTLIQQVSKVRLEFKRALVVCPLSLVQNWGNEVRKWLGVERLKAMVVDGGSSSIDAKQQFIDFKTGNVYPVLITSYELLRKYFDIIGSLKLGLLVCDEAHRLKNCFGNKTIDALSALQCPRRVLLTGTPVQNNLNEFYAMMEFANPNLLGPLSTFKRLYTEPIERSRDRSASMEEKEIGQARSLSLKTRTQFCILRRTASVNKSYLPLKTEYILFCRPSPSQILLYLEVLKSKPTIDDFCVVTFSEEIKGSPVHLSKVCRIVSEVITDLKQSANYSSILQVICLLRKLCNHPKLADKTFFQAMGTMGGSNILESLEETAGKGGCQKLKSQYRFEPGDSSLSGKLHCLDLLLSSALQSSSNTRDRVVIVSNFTQTLDIIQGLCDHRCWKSLRLDGTTNTSCRQQLVDHFNNALGDELIFLLSSKAGGVGLNLIGANRLVLFDPDWNPAIDAQAMARVWREGQRKPVIIYRFLTTGSIEEKIYQRQVMKGEVAATIEGHTDSGIASKRSGQHFSREELQELFTLRLDTLCDTYDLLAYSKVPTFEDWKDYSRNVQDLALKDAINDGTISFVYQNRGESKVDVE